MNNLAEKTAFVTGGTKGIGYGIAEALLSNGIQVAITGRNQETLTQAVEKLQAAHTAKIIGIKADVQHYIDQEQAVQKTVEEFGKIDIVVANAGLGHFATIDQLTVAQWNETIATNLSGVFYTLKASLPQLRQQKGYFFSISSLAGTNFFKGGSAYNASKFGVTGFTQAAMLDMREWDIKTSVIMPGSVATYFNGNTPDEADAWKIQKEDIGQIIVDLLQMNQRVLPSKIEVRPSFPHKK